WKNWAVAYLFETRSGFPFSVQRDNGQIVGPVNAYRLPMYFNLNLHVERRFHYRSNLLAIRAGRSEEHTSELQSRFDLVCRLLLEPARPPCSILFPYTTLFRSWKNWAVAYLFETRSGFPFSVQRDNGQIVGPVNAYRLPMYFNLNLHVERRFHYRSNLLAIRAG